MGRCSTTPPRQGLLSASGAAFHVFTDEPGTLAMTTLPWVFAPAMFVPIDLLVHVAIAAKLKALPRPALAMVG
jgi:hypothetical protein